MPDLIPGTDLAALEARAATTRAALNPRQAKFVEGLIAGSTLLAAGLAAGYRDPSRYASLLARKPLVAAAIDAARALAAARAGYGHATLMAELGEAMAFALKTDNAAAYVRAIELRGKATGLLVDRLDARVAVGGFVLNVHGLEGGNGA